jgi:CubicO group peptidase (beta-lactamase class C family)
VKARMFTLTVLIIACSAQVIHSQGAERNYWPTTKWQTISSEKAGFDNNKLKKMDHLLGTELPLLSSLLVVRNGYLVHELYIRGDAETLRQIYSETKTVISILVGILFKNTKIKQIDRPLLETLSELRPDKQPSNAEKITIRNALTMSTGLPDDEGEGTMSVATMKDLLTDGMKYPPGAVFAYNGTNANILSLLISRRTGESAEVLAKATLFKTLGITRYTWEERQGLSNGAYGLSLSSRDLAKIGYLYLNEGRWEKEQIVSKEWVRESTRPLIKAVDPVSRLKDYGFLWWIRTIKGHSAYLALGFGGQVTTVIPNLDLVVVVTSYEDSNDRLGNYIGVVEDYVLPAMK